VRFHCLRTTDADLLYTFFQMLGTQTRAWFRPHTPWTYAVAKDLAAESESPDVIRFLALVEKDGNMVPAGYGFFEKLQSARPVLGIAVADAYQEVGLGQAIMQHLKQVARQLGKKRIILTVDGDNLRAQHVYGKMGFTMTRLIPGSSHRAREMACIL
jgi:ribosomal protein S18 acetylase RimI-like enzyme